MKEWDVNHHFVVVRAPAGTVAPLAREWGEGRWWPPDARMRFERSGNGGLGVGTRFTMRMLRPPARWEVEVTRDEPGRLIERTFRTGIFEGREVVAVEGRADGTRVDYRLHFRIRDAWDRLKWRLIGRRMHDAEIEKVLGALKAHAEGLEQIKEN